MDASITPAMAKALVSLARLLGEQAAVELMQSDSIPQIEEHTS